MKNKLKEAVVPLTAGQIKEFDELKLDSRAADETLSVALQYHSNLTARLKENEIKLWRDILSTHDLDDSVIWEVTEVDGKVSIARKKDKDES